MILPLPALLAVTLIVLGAMLAGFAGPPARRPRPGLAWTLFAVGVAGLALSAGLLFTTSSRLDALIAAASACALALSARYLREPGDGEPPPDRSGPDDRPGPPEPDPPREPWNWDDFDHARALWSGRREGAGR